MSDQAPERPALAPVPDLPPATPVTEPIVAAPDERPALSLVSSTSKADQYAAVAEEWEANHPHDPRVDYEGPALITGGAGEAGAADDDETDKKHIFTDRRAAALVLATTAIGLALPGNKANDRATEGATPAPLVQTMNGPAAQPTSQEADTGYTDDQLNALPSQQVTIPEGKGAQYAVDVADAGLRATHPALAAQVDRLVAQGAPNGILRADTAYNVPDVPGFSEPDPRTATR